MNDIIFFKISLTNLEALIRNYIKSKSQNLTSAYQSNSEQRQTIKRVSGLINLPNKVRLYKKNRSIIFFQKGKIGRTKTAQKKYFTVKKEGIYRFLKKTCKMQPILKSIIKYSLDILKAYIIHECCK